MCLQGGGPGRPRAGRASTTPCLAAADRPSKLEAGHVMSRGGEGPLKSTVMCTASADDPHVMDDMTHPESKNPQTHVMDAMTHPEM